MKKKYVVFTEDWQHSENGQPKYKEIKSFKHAPDALNFVSAQKNINMYGTMFLRCHADDGQYEWDSLLRTWVHLDGGQI